ncbi:MAG: molybdenum cofactor biosynthesis protein MoaE [Polyangiaceae bacterium]
MFVRIDETALDATLAVSHVAHPGAGGIDVFYGVVRETSEGRPVTLLEYSAYGTMATREMERIALEIEAEVPGVRVAALHRVGALSVGELAVVCAASAPHRDEAFRACRMLIDRIKASVPIWKREHGPDGAYWVGWADARCEGSHDHPHDLAHGARTPHR